MKVGDLLFCSGSGLSSKFINCMTYAWPNTGFSHVGILGELHGDWLLYESLASCPLPCVRAGYKTEGVQAHYLDDILALGGGDYCLVPLARELYRHEVDRLLWYLDSQIGKPYDMIGAVRSGGMLLRLIESVVRTENLNTMFCAEFVAAALRHVGYFMPRNASSYSPNWLYRAMRRDGLLGLPQEIPTPPALAVAA